MHTNGCLCQEIVNWPHAVLETHGHSRALNDNLLPLDVQMYSTERQRERDKEGRRGTERERKVTLNSQLASA